jgi:integrase
MENIRASTRLYVLYVVCSVWQSTGVLSLRCPRSPYCVESITGTACLRHKREAKYLAAAREPLVSIATVLVDSGMRPEECFKLRWENINLHGERHGWLRVLEGKTRAARRVIPLTKRAHGILEMLWENGGKPNEGCVWPAATKQGHVWHDSIRVQHKKALKASKVRAFVVYAFRHTFLTRLGESGCDVWTLARIAGHSSIKMSERYVHASGEAALNAMSRLPLPISE